MQLRRIIDVVLGTVLLVATLPLMVIVAIAVKLDDGGPVFFRQERAWTNGDTFMLWKFRTMKADNTQVTRVGRVLRLAVVDELPNIFNVVLSGGRQLSLVGPRPWIPEEQRRAADLGGYWSGREDHIPGWASPAAQTGCHWYNPLCAEFDRDFEENWSPLRHVLLALVNFILPVFGRRRLNRPDAVSIQDYPWPLRSRTAGRLQEERKAVLATQ